MLENPKSEKVTTARAGREARRLGAALYRHFASKAQMYEGLISSSDRRSFRSSTRSPGETTDGVAQAEQTVVMLLSFAEKGPG